MLIELLYILAMFNIIAATHLLYKGCFKCHQHEQSKDTVVPILIKTPQAHTENLKNKKWSSGPFPEKFPEVRNTHFQPVEVLKNLKQ